MIYLVPPNAYDAVPREPEMLREQGIEFVQVPMQWDKPTDADYDAFAAAMNRLGSGKVLVHCQINLRASSMTFLYRAIALGEVRTRQWARVLLRELTAGLALGVILGCIGFARIMLWPTRNQVYGPDYVMVAFTIAFSLVGIVLWGTVAGSMLPLILRRFGLDPASASAPFVATIVDVTGLIIYFNVARMILGGILL